MKKTATLFPIKDLDIDPRLARIVTRWQVLVKLTGKHKEQQKEKREEQEAEWMAFQKNIQENGILEPLKAWRDKTGKLWLCDGRHRLRTAQDLNFIEVPVIEVTEAQAAKIMEATLLGRRHLSKTGMAYSAVALHPEVAVETKRGPKANSAAAAEISQAELAARFGVSERYIVEACALYRDFSASKTLRERYEHLVYDGSSFENIRVARAGGEATAGKTRNSEPTNIMGPVKSLFTFYKHYAKRGEEDRQVALEQAQKSLAEGDAEVLTFLAELVAGAHDLKHNAAVEEGAE